MRLINVHTYQLSQFFDNDTPKYVILSHTWGEQEVTIQDMIRLQNGIDTFEVESMVGFGKVKYTCEQARRDGFDWAWVDTCCIDKTSSAELAEAINSMYRWYELAEVCYAYLIDVPANSNITARDSAFRNSRWFSRGWTLQELIAPRKLDVYGEGWTYVGRLSSSLEGQEFASLLEEITGISRYCLLKWRSPRTFSVAHCLSWAADRKCTRVEDLAYCLLGIFDVNMPLIYGEGKKAFARLQEEIIKTIDDHSILAWTVKPNDPRAGTIGNVLAESPADFSNSSSVFSLHSEIGVLSAMTKNGLQVQIFVDLPHHLDPIKRKKAMASAVLNCSSGGVLKRRIKLLLVQPFLSDNEQANNTYCRYITTDHQYFENADSQICVLPQNLKTIYIRKHIPALELNQYLSLGSLYIHNLPTESSTYRAMCPSNRRGYRIANVDTGTLPDWDAAAAVVRYPSPDKISLHAFLVESTEDADMVPFVFICGIKRDSKVYAQQAVFCILLESDRDADAYIRDIAEDRLSAPWTLVRNKTGYLTSAVLSICDLWIRVELQSEDGIEHGVSAGKKQIYRANFSFGGYDMINYVDKQRRLLSLGDPVTSRVNQRLMLDAAEQREILARIVARRGHRGLSATSTIIGSRWGGSYMGYTGGGYGAILGAELSKFR